MEASSHMLWHTGCSNTRLILQDKALQQQLVINAYWSSDIATLS
jgi:hypothetical protein